MRIIRKLLLESLLVAATGGVLGLAIARLGLALFVSSASRSAWMSWIAADYSLDREALFYTIAISACTGLLFGIAPALRLATEDVATAVKDGARGTAGTKHGRRFSSLLVVTETALAVVLLAGAGVMVRSFLKLYNADIGIDTDHVLSFNLEWPDSKRLPPTEEGLFYDGLLADLDAIPGIESASLVRPLPSETAGPQPYEIDGEPSLRAAAGRVLIAPSYFHAVGTSILAGREFSSMDRTAAQPVALVNERFASQYFPSQSALGKRIRLADRNWGSSPSGTAAPPWRIIVGVVSNIKQNMAKPGFLPLVYFPYLSDEERGVNVIARTHGPPERLIAAIRLEVQKANPALTVWRLEPLTATLQKGYWKSQFYGTLFLSFAAVALLLAATGLYAVMALEVSRRTREIGVRIAIGGSAGAVSGLVLRQAMAPVVIGLAAGLAVAFATNRVLQEQLVQVSPSDPLTMALTALALLAAALAGCAVPALRAVGIDPTVTLRNE